MRGGGWRTGLAAAALLVAVAVLTARIIPRLGAAGACGARECALADFRDAVYYPVVAFLRGENPYDRAAFVRRYPVVTGMGIYSPLTFPVHLPFGLVPYAMAAPLYYGLSVLLTIGLGALALRICGVPATTDRVLGVGAFLVLSRPGHWNLFTGQMSLTVTLATYAALWLATTRPWLAAVGLAVATLKPTYGAPLALLMLARGDWRALGIGVGITVLLTGAVLARLVAVAGGDALAASVVESLARVDSPAGVVATWPFRVDVGALARVVLGPASTFGPSLGLTFAVLAVAGLGLRRLARSDQPDAPVLAVGLASLAIVTCVYHQQYDVVALTVPLLSLVWPAGSVWERRPGLRRATLVLVGLPFVNYLASGNVADHLGLSRAALLALCAMNNVALLGALAVFTWLALRGARG